MANEPAQRHVGARPRNPGTPKQLRHRFSLAAVGALNPLGRVPRACTTKSVTNPVRRSISGNPLIYKAKRPDAISTNLVS
ncbi:hypothetical protein Bcep1808_6118 [Burkholderia vietnamiensis G4]|uniref:Uncharacterized protein n=1 Tax=Burkholderia vietnamiensis (strain G4 / LMG 22486) TaxID=269482 RepID=A4JRY3_BURVG|nr:hypothetical protein Bcep1808_6118 [Burkholderia vietnamiensis G4]